jgi:hypothetical protein
MRHSLILGACTVCFAGIAWGATPVATYEFQNTFAADQAGVTSLTAVDPETTSSFVTDTVLGNSQTVWAFNGINSPAADQAGLTLNTTSLLTDPGNYSVDMVLEFTQRDGAYRRLIDVQNRQSDNGFYVDPSNDLDIFPISGSSAAWSNNVFHHVVLTVDDSTSPATVSAYLDGVSQFTTSTNEMNLNADVADNPNQLLTFFLDNIAAGGQGEWSPGEVAFIRLWDGALTPTEAEALLPEPSTLALFAAAGLLLQRRRNRI